MRLDHLAIWAADVEQLKDFYLKYFARTAGNIYHNPQKSFTSSFISFSEDCRLELMHNSQLALLRQQKEIERPGPVQFAISLGSKKAVDTLTKRLAADGQTVTGHPRITGDGY